MRTGSARSVYYYSFYLFLMGFGLLIIPNQLLVLLALPTTEEIWIRVLGIFTLTVGIYYFYSARREQTDFFMATVYGRFFFFLALTILCLLQNFSIMLAAIGVVDLLGASWTLRELRREKP